MYDSSVCLIRWAMARTSPRRAASRSCSIRGSTVVTVCIGFSFPSLKSFVFQISVARQPFLVAAQQVARLLDRHLLGAQGSLGRLPHLRHQVVAAVAHVAQDV